VAGAVLHVGDLAGVGLAVGARAQFVQQRADAPHDAQVGHLVVAADVVGFTRPARFEHAADGAAVVAHVEPVAHLLAVAVDREILAREGVDDDQRNELFGELQRAVVVAAVGGEHRQAVGVVPGAHQVVAGGLAGRIRAVGQGVVLLGEGRVGGRERAVDLVGGDVQEAKCFFFRSW